MHVTKSTTERWKIIRSTACSCQVCLSPVDRKMQAEIFSDLVATGHDQVVNESAATDRDAFALDFIHAHELLDYEELEDLAKCLCESPVNVDCLKIVRLAELIRDAGADAGFFGPIAVNKILNAQPPLRQKRYGRRRT